MKVYLVWAKEVPEDTDTMCRDRYIEMFPDAAEYGPFYLFPAEHEQVAQIQCEVVDLSTKRLVETVEFSDAEMTFADFGALAQGLIDEGFSGRCIVLSTQQGRFLRDSMFAVDVDLV